MLAVLAWLAVWLLPALAFFWLIWLLALWLALEWVRLTGLVGNLQCGLFVASVGVPLGFWGLTIPTVDETSALMASDWLINALLYLSGAAWLLAFVLVLTYPRLRFFQHQLFWIVLGWLILTSAAVTFIWLRMTHGIEAIFYLICLVAAADIGAYFIGKRLGNRRLAALVSPGKTWEGYIGGLFISLLTAYGFGLLVLNIGGWKHWFWYFVASALVAGFSVVGDLTESLLKRTFGSKDSGTLLPGHGGLLDRADAILAAAPLLALGLKAGYFPLFFLAE